MDMNHQWPFHRDRSLHFCALCFKESSHWPKTISWLLRAFPWFVCTVFPVSQERCHNSWSRAVVHSSLVDCAALLQSKEALGRHPLSTGYGTSASTSASTSMLTSASTSPCTEHQHYTFLDSCFWAANLFCWHSQLFHKCGYNQNRCHLSEARRQNRTWLISGAPPLSSDRVNLFRHFCITLNIEWIHAHLSHVIYWYPLELISIHLLCDVHIFDDEEENEEG